MTFFRYIKEKEVHEHFLFCKPLKTTTKALNILNAVSEFLAKHNLPLDVIGSVCSNGPQQYSEIDPDLPLLCKKEIPGVKITHCVLHRHALVAKTLSPNLK